MDMAVWCRTYDVRVMSNIGFFHITLPDPANRYTVSSSTRLTNVCWHSLLYNICPNKEVFESSYWQNMGHVTGKDFSHRIQLLSSRCSTRSGKCSKWPKYWKKHPKKDQTLIRQTVISFFPSMTPFYVFFRAEYNGLSPIALQGRQRVQNAHQSWKKGRNRSLADSNLFLFKQDTPLCVFLCWIQRWWSRVSPTSGSGGKRSSKVKNAKFGLWDAKKVI